MTCVRGCGRIITPTVPCPCLDAHITRIVRTMPVRTVVKSNRFARKEK